MILFYINIQFHGESAIYPIQVKIKILVSKNIKIVV